MRYFIELSYKGTDFHGWQRQPNATSVQQSIEEALSKLLRQGVDITGCGRTDTGVHSGEYFAHFECTTPHTIDQKFIYHLNSILPHSIAIHRIFECDKHARFDATEREYKYTISRTKNPFTVDTAWYLSTELDETSMQAAADKLLEYSDFSSFEKLHSDNKTSLCKITTAQWHFTPQCYVFTIAADRFLRGMVRAIVGTLVEVGRGKITPDEFAQIIEAQDRGKASSAAPAQGLSLTKITY